jgi:hypothetical protein
VVDRLDQAHGDPAFYLDDPGRFDERWQAALQAALLLISL